ncbi:hypothetical protein ZYGR_0P00760 [Zygosaccharomyces rouxii]|uniref:ZYRO0E01892p n=2 Tax=Zygosaccharomyces rouxii TaxID=4956 RepID=C5E413_ZYGRC|nr:uncharacterized protein ZYRO0E01892g [Zygosaccharomyces rouxii]GAV49433.1 hypothetical protein ZYGR_0P00760 [Zygosaccharomyces rouxii]CAR30774.1 ZYRO0E01892p [Zygosaccharomyces rouxii]
MSGLSKCVVTLLGQPGVDERDHRTSHPSHTLRFITPKSKLVEADEIPLKESIFLQTELNCVYR